MAKRIKDKDQLYSPLDSTRIAELSQQGSRPHDRPTVLRTSTLRTKVTSVEKRRFLRLVTRLGDTLDASVSPSHLLRPLIELTIDAERKLLAEAERAAPVYRPPNDRRDELDRFEDRIRSLLLAAIVGRHES